MFYSKKEANDHCIIGNNFKHYFIDIINYLFIAAICRNMCRTLGVKLVYKRLDSNQWIWEEDNRSCRDLLTSKVYDFSVPVDTAALSKEAEGFLSRIGLLYDPERSKKVANALDLEARNVTVLVESNEGNSTKTRTSTRKKTPRSIAIAADPTPTPRMPKTKQQVRRPRSKTPQPYEGSSSPPPLSRSPSIKRMDTKSTPPKSESEEFKMMKKKMDLLQAELVQTKLQFEERQVPSIDKSTSEIVENTLANAANLKHTKETAELNNASEVDTNKENNKGYLSVGSVGISDQLTLQMMDFHTRESMSRQQKQIELRRQTAIEEDLIQQRRDYHELQMQIMRNILGRR